MEIEEFVRVPEERVSVIIGKKGSVKREIERLFNCKLEIVEGNDVIIKGAEPLKVLRARDVIQAIARGFSPQNALKLRDSNLMLEVISLQELLGRNSSKIRRQKARIIGTGGSVRKQMEEMTNTLISVYGKTISVIGPPVNVKLVRDAVTMLVKGAKHSTVYNFLSRNAHLIDDYPFRNE